MGVLRWEIKPTTKVQMINGIIIIEILGNCHSCKVQKYINHVKEVSPRVIEINEPTGF